ncbi:MAG: hypothetical protein HYX60_00830, partial [Legionella longbeachae]|nr:hypothetical protein [Legionella longbeachae]
IRKPLEGSRTREGTPEKDILEKHPELYSDMTLDHAFKKRMLCHSDKFFKAQKVSEWQKNKVVYEKLKKDK